MQGHGTGVFNICHGVWHVAARNRSARANTGVLGDAAGYGQHLAAHGFASDAPGATSSAQEHQIPIPAARLKPARSGIMAPEVRTNFCGLLSTVSYPVSAEGSAAPQSGSDAVRHTLCFGWNPETASTAVGSRLRRREATSTGVSRRARGKDVRWRTTDHA